LTSGIGVRNLKLHAECTQGSRHREARFPEEIFGRSTKCPVGDRRSRYGIGGASKLFGPEVIVKVLVERPVYWREVASEWYQSLELVCVFQAKGEKKDTLIHTTCVRVVSEREVELSLFR
jgi:hypothetical protein